MAAPSVLDLSRLEIALGGDTSLIGDILSMYEATAADDVAGLKAAVDAGDATLTSRKAHSLKGASANVGADRMADVASKVEQAAKAGRIEQAVALMPTLLDTFDDTLSACRTHRAA